MKQPQQENYAKLDRFHIVYLSKPAVVAILDQETRELIEIENENFQEKILKYVKSIK